MQILKTCLLGCQIARSIKQEPNLWRMTETAGWNTTALQCDSKHLRILVTPYERCPCLRILDQLRITLFQGLEFPEAAQDVYISILGRIKIRRAVREYMVDRVGEQMNEESLEC